MEQKKRYIYITEDGKEIEFNSVSCRTILGITAKTLFRYEGIVGTTSINEIIAKYNEDRKNQSEIIDVEAALQLDRKVKSSFYKVIQNGTESKISYPELVKILRQRNSNLRTEYIDIYLKRIIKQGKIDDVDIIAEINSMYEEAVKKKRAEYLFPDKNGNLVPTSINSILRAYKSQNPDSKITFDKLAELLEEFDSDPAVPKDSIVQKAFEFYENNTRRTNQRFLYKKDDGQYVSLLVREIKEEWKKKGFDFSKHETVLKYLNQAASIPDIKPEEIEEKAFEMIQDIFLKYDYQMPDGTIKKMTFRKIAEEEKKKGNVMKTATLIGNFKKIKSEVSGNEDVSECELVKLAIKRTLKNERKKYPYQDKDGNIVEMTYTEISRLEGINRTSLAKAIKKINLSGSDKIESDKLILLAIEMAKKAEKTETHVSYQPSKKYSYKDKDGNSQEITVVQINAKLREKGIRVTVENLQRALDKVLAQDKISLENAIEKALINIEANSLKNKKIQKRNFLELQKSELSIILGLTISEVNSLFQKFEKEDGTLDEEAFEQYCESLSKKAENLGKSKEKLRNFVLSDGKTLRRYCEENGYNYDVIIGNLDKIERETGKINLAKAIEEYKDKGQNTPFRYKFATYDVLLRHVTMQFGVNFDDVVYRMRKYNWPLKMAIEETIISHDSSDSDFVRSTIIKMQYSEDDEKMGEAFKKFKQLSTPEEKRKMNDILRKTQTAINTIKYINFATRLSEFKTNSEEAQRKSATTLGINYDEYRKFISTYRDFFEGNPGYLKAPASRPTNPDDSDVSK